MVIIIFVSSLHNNSCSEVDEIYKICSVIGSPTKDSWADGLSLAKDINYQFPQVSFAFLGVLCMCQWRF